MVADLTYPHRDAFEKLTIIISVLSICLVCEGLQCEGFFKGCCPGSLWNTTSQQCEKCMPGYVGINCSSLCPYPSYGVECQRLCNCSRELCDVSTGCKDLTTDKDIKISHQNSSLAEENDITTTAENNNSPMQNNSTNNKSQQPSAGNTKILMCIRMFGSVDIVLICIYLALYFYDRQHRSFSIDNTNGNVPGNNSTYENAQVFFFSATGNQLM